MKESDVSPAALLQDDWEHIDKRSLDDCRAPEWRVLGEQKNAYLRQRCADEILRMLRMQKDDPSFGYSVNMYEHCLQTATMMHRDGLPEEDVVVGLLHDIGYMVCPENHGAFAALLLRPYISERNHWMLEKHEVFQQVHFHELEGVNRDERERWRGHPFFEWTERFVAKYDQLAINRDEEILPIEFFEPMVRRVLSLDRAMSAP